MHIDRLEYIVEVAKTGSLSIASQNLHITQSAMSQAITSVEQELGVQIFLRNRKGTRITFEGSKIVELANEIIIKYQELKEVAFRRHELSGELKIASIAGLMQILMKCISGFKKEHPNVQILFSEKGSREIVDDVVNYKYDLGLVHFYSGLLDEQKELLFKELLKGRILASVRKDSHFAIKGSIKPEELLRENLVLYNDDAITCFTNDFINQFGPINILFISDNAEAIRSAVFEGSAITLAVDFTLLNSPNIVSGRAVTLPIVNYEQPPLSFGLIQNRRNQSSVILDEFLAFIKAELKQSNLKNYLCI